MIKILVLEDTDGDGTADKSTVFADGLLIPTGIAPGDGGCYVANSTEILHLADTDGDGKADTRRVVLSGFGTEDTHHMIHTFRWGYDGDLYFNQSVYIHSHIETPFGPERLGGGGIWRYRPEDARLEVFARGFINPWGHHYDRWGQHFATDGAGFEGVAHVVPGATYTALSNPERFLRGLNPGSPKYCGAVVVSGRHLPDDLVGDLVTNDFRANRVCRFDLIDDGSGFVAREQQPVDPVLPRRLPTHRHAHGPRRRPLRRRLVQPDHPARRGRLPRPPPRPRARPHLADHRQGPPARRPPEARRRRRRPPCSTP